ncbi:MAG: hypothetical protein H6721_30900 [Sandaracinus sp.]|nr:hypothetical protein [Sandaracinus sp.]MCB9636541.1 hypothetical protein [Sandaracinus sp.]
MWLVGLALGCQTGPDFMPPRDGDPLTLGELVYQVLHQNLGRADACGTEYADTLAIDRERFVVTFDTAIGEDEIGALPELLGEAILPVVDDGSLPDLTEAVAEALALLVDAELDPDRTALRSALEIAQTRSVLETSHALELMRRVLADPELPDHVHALARLGTASSGDDDVVGLLLGLAARNLEAVGEPSACGELTLPGLSDTLLRTEGFVPLEGRGAPAWVVRADENGNPRVRTSSLTGRLYAPFVDADGDGAADVDDFGRPVDEEGLALDLEAFGVGTGFDGEGRALADDGSLLFEYVDMKQTVLARVLLLGDDALEAGAHLDLVDVAEAALGRPEACPDEPDCRTYGSEDHPVADTAYLALELLKDDHARSLVDTVATLVDEDPELAEDLLVALGRLIEALERTDLSLTDRQLLTTGVDLLPLLDRTFEADASGESTPRVLLGVVSDLGDTARAFPEQMGWMIDYRDLEKTRQCSSDAPNLAASVPVDYSQPRYYTVAGRAVDNRSALEQVIELLDVADCGDVPFTDDRTVAYVALDLLADRSPSTVCGVIDAAIGAIDVLPGASDFVVSTALDTIGCDGDRVFRALRSLETLAESGALDFLLPVARVFKERGQLELLIEILRFVATDLRLDENGDPGSRSVVRRLLPALSEVLASGAADVLFDMLDLMVSIRAEGREGDTLADVMMDSLAFVVDGDQTVRTRTGMVTGTSHARELLLTLRTLVDRLRTSPRGRPAFDRLVDHLTGYLTRRTRVDGRDVLENRDLVPLAQILTQVARDATDRPRAEYQCWLGELQSGVDGFLTGRDLADVVRVAKTLDGSDDGEHVQAWLRTFLAPGDVDEELYGPTLQVVGGVLGSDLTGERAAPMLRWLGQVADQRRGDGAEIVTLVDRILTSDERGTMLAIAENFLSPAPLDPSETGIEVYADIFDSVTDVTSERMCVLDQDVRFTVDEAETTVSGIVEFMQDDAQGLGAIYGLIGRRRDAPAP